MSRRWGPGDVCPRACDKGTFHGTSSTPETPGLVLLPRAPVWQPVPSLPLRRSSRSPELSPSPLWDWLYFLPLNPLGFPHFLVIVPPQTSSRGFLLSEITWLLPTTKLERRRKLILSFKCMPAAVLVNLSCVSTCVRARASRPPREITWRRSWPAHWPTVWRRRPWARGRFLTVWTHDRTSAINIR